MTAKTIHARATFCAVATGSASSGDSAGDAYKEYMTVAWYVSEPVRSNTFSEFSSTETKPTAQF